MDPILLARIQFAFTICFHYIFPLITIGLAWLIVYFMWKYKNSDDPVYENISRFWIRLFTVTFAVGVATGITMEFQFGTNWAEYSRFVGDIFGAPLAAEGIFAFFLESAFIAVLIFGWDRFSKKTLWFASLMVAIGSTLSAFWIIVANSWMQTPAGFHIANGRAELTSFFKAVFNPSTLPRFLHTVDGALMTGSFFMLGISAWFLLKNKNIEFAKKSLKAALIFAFITSSAQLGLGHYHAIQVTNTQPEKLATFEGLENTQRNAPAIIFGIPVEETRTVKNAVRIPGALSFMISGDSNTEVKGMNEFSKEELPPFVLTFLLFHSMVALGMYFIGISALGILLLFIKKLFDSRLFLKLALITIPLPIIANELGWIAAEVGRQPWAIYRVLKTSESVSISVSPTEILFSIIMFSLIYLLLFIAWIFLIKQHMNKKLAEVNP